MSKVFAFSTRARRRGSQCCAARLISGNGCSGKEGRPKAPDHKRNKGKAGWRKKMESRYGEVAVASTSGNEHQRSQLTGSTSPTTVRSGCEIAPHFRSDRALIFDG